MPPSGAQADRCVVLIADQQAAGTASRTPDLGNSAITVTIVRRVFATGISPHKGIPTGARPTASRTPLARAARKRFLQAQQMTGNAFP